MKQRHGAVEPLLDGRAARGFKMDRAKPLAALHLGAGGAAKDQGHRDETSGPHEGSGSERRR